MFKNLMRCVAMLAAVIVATDAFAQGLNRFSGPNALRNRVNRPAAAQQAAPAAKAEGGEETKPANKDIPALNWDAAPVDIVLQAYADQVDKTYLKDPAVPNATITLKSREGQKMTQEEYLEAIEVILEMNGIHIEPYGEKFLRVLPRKEVRKEGIPIIMDSETRLADSGKVVSLMVQLKNISTEDGQKTLDNFKSGSGIIIGFERTNSILITDTEANINRMLEIIRCIDVATPVLENVFVRQIKNASAEDIKTALEAIVAESQKELEKSGNRNAANVAQPSTQSRFGNNRLLGGNKQAQPAAPVSNNSLVMTVSDADRGMIRGKVLILADERSNKLVIVTQKPNMDFFDKVIEQLDIETTPDTVVKVYRLKYAEAEEVSDMINDLIGNSGSSRSSGKENQNRTAKQGGGSNLTRGGAAATPRKSANQRTGEAKAGELTKDNTTVLADKRINGLVVMTEKELVPTIEQIIESMDIKLSQVLIETVIIEVTLGDGIMTGMDWVQKGRKTVTKNDAATATGSPLYYKSRTTTMTNAKTGESKTTTSLLGDMVEGGYSYDKTTTDEKSGWTTKITETASDIVGQTTRISHDGLANYYTAGTYTAIGGGQGGVVAQQVAEGITSNLFGKAFNFIFDSDELGIKGILQASKTDSHSKYIASPIIMTLDNKEATIEATQMRYLFKGYQYSGSTYNGSAVPDYEQKELGITIKVTPKINPNGTVMLTLEEEYSQEGPKQGIEGEKGTFNAATTVTRKMSADALLENNQTVIFAGLTETSTSEAESGIPILKDIPWIGKWLFGTVQRDENRTELLVFMTPYVLDDADAAQAEAIRRKRAVSDQHAWDDHGWSASALADPVSKKEQLRRLKAEWKKQDEEREAKVAIEKEKVERVKALEKMSKAERKVWLEMHKEELKEEEKDELEKKMLDEDSQEDLKKLADDIKAKKLKAANKELDKVEKEFEQDNEYNRLKREREEKAKAVESGEKGESSEKVKVKGEQRTDSVSEDGEKGEAKPAEEDSEKK